MGHVVTLPVVASSFLFAFVLALFLFSISLYYWFIDYHGMIHTGRMGAHHGRKVCVAFYLDGRFDLQAGAIWGEHGVDI